MRAENEHGIPLGFTSDEVPAGTHFCYISNNDAERLRIMSKFVESGLLAGERGMDLAGVVEHEARLTPLLLHHPSTVCCQYDSRRFSGAILMDVLSVHPVMRIRGQLVRNPLYLEPADFLEELRLRNRVPDAVRATAN